MRRRRRFRGTWLPNLGSFVSDTDNSAGRRLSVDVAANGNTTVGVIPLVLDHPQEPDLLPQDAGLNDFVGNEYVIRRIVGKVFVQLNTFGLDGNTLYDRPVVVTAGLFIARASDDSDAGAGDLPIGGLGALVNNYRPDNVNTIREPWIWRRQWVLGDPGAQIFATESTDGLQPATLRSWGWPSTNAHYGSIQDGPHLDAKTRRRVTSDDRLWFAVEARNFPEGTTAAAVDPVPSVLAKIDYRVFGALRKARNRGNF